MTVDHDGPPELFWRDGLGTVFVLVPDHPQIGANVREMGRFRRSLLRAWLMGVVEVLDHADTEEKPDA